MNTDRFEQFEIYLSGTMSSEEKAIFEAELSADEELQTTLEVYRTIETEMRGKEQNTAREAALRESLETINDKHFQSGTAGKTPRIIPFYTSKVYRWAVAVAAVLTIGVVAYMAFFIQKQDTRQLAAAYYDENLDQLSQTMDGARDSLQLGIAAYNNRDFKTALVFFNSIYNQHPDNTEALKNAGITYLATRNYEKALNTFEELSAIENMYANPGNFLTAVTLMLRNGEGDREKAQLLLRKVVNEKAEGSNEAKEWLDRF